MRMNPHLDFIRAAQAARPGLPGHDRAPSANGPQSTPPIAAHRRGRSGFAIAIVLLSLFLAGSVQGADGQGNLVDLSLEELMNIDVVYGASKYEQPTSDAPASITIIRSEEIARHGYQTLAEVLTNIRGFYTTYDRNYDYLGVRGFGRPGDYNTRVLILIDGLRQNDNLYSSTAVGTEFCLDLELIERIEVIRGPGASLYGTNAMFGVLNIITKESTGEARAALEGASGSEGLRSGRIAVSGVRDSGPKWTATGTAYRRRGRDLFYEVFNSTETNNGVADGVDGDEYQRFFGKARWQGLTFLAAYSRREKVLPTAAWETVFNDPRNRTMDGHTWAGLTWQKPVGASTDLWSAVAFHRYVYEGDYVYEDYGSGQESPDGTILLEDQAIGDWWTAESRAVFRGIKGHGITAGLEGSASRRAYQKTFDPYEVYLSSDTPTWNWGAYLQDDYRAASWCLLNLGSRLDVYESFGSTVNPRASAILTPVAGTTLKLLYGRAFRAPNAYESYYTDGGITAKASESLKPERIETVGAVLEQYVGFGSFGTVEAFRYRLEDLIENGVDPADDLLVFDNRAEARARGLEFGLRREWVRGLVGRTGIVFQEAWDGHTQERLSNSPERLGYVSGSLPLAAGRGSVAFDLRHVGRRANVHGEEVPSYWTGDVAAAAWVVPGRIRVLGRVQNVANMAYYDPGAEEHLQPSIEQDGRTWRLAITANL